MSYAIGLPFTATTLVVNCKCGTAAFLTWTRAMIKGWTYERSMFDRIHDKMRPACMNGVIYGDVIFIVRDPLARFVSCYYDKISNPDERRYHRPGVTIDQWAEMLVNHDYLNSNEHWRPQAHILSRIHDHSRITFVTLELAQLELKELYTGLGIPTPTIVNQKAEKRRYTGSPYEIASDNVKSTISSVYRADELLFQEAR